MCVPKYFKAVDDHCNLKLDCKCVSCGCGIPTPIASDFAKLIFKLESCPYVVNSCNKFGREVVGEVSENIRSSAYADTLCWLWSTVTPEMLGFKCMWQRNGSRERAKSRGDSGHP